MACEAKGEEREEPEAERRTGGVAFGERSRRSEVERDTVLGFTGWYY